MVRVKTPPSTQELLSRIDDARARTDELFTLVRPEALYDRPIPERHRIVFYIGHLEAFDWNLIGRRAGQVESFHPAFDKLFAFGIDPTDGGLPNDQTSDWPAIEQVREYNRKVRQTVDEVLRNSDPASADQPLFRDGLAAQVAIEHRLMHVETLAYMLQQLPAERKIARSDPPSAGRASALRMVRIPAGAATLGLPRSGDEFGWDNEFESHSVQVPAFAIESLDVTNARFLEFLRAGGYENRGLWTDEDWAWRQGSGIEHPGLWRRDARGEWLYRGMFGDRPLPPDWPAFVSHAEARAFARWSGKSLPTEAQFHRAAYGTPDGTERRYPWGDDAPDSRKGNFDFSHWDPVPVGATPEGDSAFGVADLLGNGWEWTATPFGPFPGFEAFPFYPGYSADFFDGKHFVMKGGAQRTAACMLRRSFRNWFQAHYPYMHATFRCVEN